MSSDMLGLAAKGAAALVTLATLVWAHGSWVSSVNFTLAETGRAMTTVSENVRQNTDKIGAVEASLVRVEADVSSVKEANVRIEAVASDLNKHVMDLREVTAELKVLVRKINRKKEK